MPLRLFFVLLLVVAPAALAAQIVTLSVPSAAMNATVETVVILPDGKERWPTIYLLHGYGCGEHPARAWLAIAPQLPELADELGVLIVCPDGRELWWLDSPVNPAARYETFMTRELPQFIDAHYPTRADRAGRAITGFSMGGYGAVWLAARSAVFGAAGASSGVFDLAVKFPALSIDTSPARDFNLTAVLGAYDDETRRAYSPRYQMAALAGLELIIDCGADDDLALAQNEQFHQEMMRRKIPHTWILRPGKHDIGYWQTAIDWQLRFFARFFNRPVR
ncbi:hypothetical protein FACS1894108_07290 [Planctomycetales bacterium]|nr:hypothetical protein FACS1894108_07290 [Planctomycetales bacterium]